MDTRNELAAYRRAWGRRVRRCRETQGLHQMDVARRTGLTGGTISNVERGVGCTDGVKGLIAHALGVPLGALFAWVLDEEEDQKVAA